MPILYIIILALVQGITEFLPVSSSGHLVLAHEILPNKRYHASEALLLDVAVHVGTLGSVLIYFRHDVLRMIKSMISMARARFVANNNTQDTKTDDLFLLVFYGSIPVVIAGFLLHSFYPDWMRSAELVAWTTLIFAIVLYISDRFPVTKTFDNLGLKDAWIIGFAQILALIPGTSRSGITMTAARFLGMSRVDCARFSLLLGVVAISGAGILGGLDIASMRNASLGFESLIACMLAFVSGYIAIALMMRWLEKASFTPFVIYRVALGLVLLALVYTGHL